MCVCVYVFWLFVSFPNIHFESTKMHQWQYFLINIGFIKGQIDVFRFMERASTIKMCMWKSNSTVKCMWNSQWSQFQKLLEEIPK